MAFSCTQFHVVLLTVSYFSTVKVLANYMLVSRTDHVWLWSRLSNFWTNNELMFYVIFFRSVKARIYTALALHLALWQQIIKFYFNLHFLTHVLCTSESLIMIPLFKFENGPKNDAINLYINYPINQSNLVQGNVETRNIIIIYNSVEQTCK